jgi:hypothetical protein
VNDQLKAFLSGLLTSLTDLRKFGHDGGHRVSYAVGQITAAERLGFLTYGQADRFRDLLLNAGKHASHPFPCDENSGPCMPIDVWWSRHKVALAVKARLAKLSARDSANEKPEPVPAPTSRPELRLLCLLGETASAESAKPVATMQPLPPRPRINGQWPSACRAPLVLRDTQARRPSASVLVRSEQHRQANAFRTAARTL